MNPFNRLALSRWPAILAALESAPAPEVTIAPTPQHTLTVDGLQLTSGYSRIGEAITQATMVSEGVDDAWCYGVGLGELPSVMLARCNKLHVVIMNLGIARASMSAVRHAWLDDPRVELHLASEMAVAFGPMAVSPIELRRADDNAVHVRDQIQTLLNADINRKMQAARKELEDGHRAGSAEALATDGHVSKLRGLYADGVIVVMGGPSAAGYYNWIRERSEAHVIICASTVLKPLLQEGIVPDYVCCIDSAPHMAKHFEVMPSSGSSLVYSPTVNPLIVSGWRGPRYYAEHGDLFPGGSVLFTAVDLAVRMGATSVYLVGADLCFPGDRSHTDGAPHPYDVSQAWRPTVINGRGERVKTEECLSQYRQNLELLVSQHPEVKWVKLGRDGVPVKGMEWLEEQDDRCDKCDGIGVHDPECGW